MLWQQLAPWDRDYFLPVTARALDHRERFKCKCSEATILSQTLDTALTIKTEPLLCDSVLGRLWREHSPRAFHTSCTTCLRCPKSWHDAFGGGSPEPQGYGKDHAKTHRTEKSKLARLLR